MAVSLNRGIIAGLIWEEGGVVKISCAITYPSNPHIDPLLKVLDPPLSLLYCGARPAEEKKKKEENWILDHQLFASWSITIYNIVHFSWMVYKVRA